MRVFPGSALLGASGIVFMLIMLASLAGMKDGRIPLTLILAAALFALPSTAQAADYNFETQAPSDYYGSTSYEDIYGSQYNYGGPNVVDYQVPELEYGVLSTTQTGIMEKALLPGLQQTVATGTGGYGISGSGSSPTVLPGVDTGAVTLPPMPQFTELTDEFLLSNGAIGRISIPLSASKTITSGKGPQTPA